ncbi:MAG: FAD-binding protein [Micromonosporaceae bacterium]|nr:FAD-binding protein [Micromonosporaceae bacterium]
MAGARNVEVDVAVVGFGAAGACAAIEAARAGADVLVIDRFDGGGATALSGGVVYAGGGTPCQRQAGVTDTPDAMRAYLETEVGDAVSPATLRRFCDQSTELIAWLTACGVPFQGSLCDYKTSYPTNRHYLYHSGSELASAHIAPPAPRGHRAHGPGTSGRVLFARLAETARAVGVEVRGQTRASRLVMESGRVTGLECRTLTGPPRLAHRLLSRLASKPFLYAPKLGRALHLLVSAIERRCGKPCRIKARSGVVIAAGGFIANRPMLRDHAPEYRGGLPLGTAGDDGSGIRLGVEVGAAADHLDRVSVWRFLSPPSALLDGVLVDRHGNRLADLARYGAAIGQAVMAAGGRAWLLVDDRIVAEARRQIRSQTLWFQRLQAWYLLGPARIRGGRTLEQVAARAGIAAPADTGSLRPPYSLIDVSVRPRLAYPAPMLTLGGLRVDEDTGAVLREDGAVIPGLYAAGRSAVGICSHSYVSGLSLADCVFSGRRAGAHAARRQRVSIAGSPGPRSGASAGAEPSDSGTQGGHQC